MMYTLGLRRIGWCIVPALALSLVGCSSMHPLPENFPENFARATTFDIVQRIRCEAQRGLRRFKSDEHGSHVIAATGIGYDFEFSMVEVNDATSGDIGFFRKPFGKGPIGSSLNFTGEAKRTRENKRTFRIIEDLADVANADCSADAAGANVVYPISGTLRVDDIVRTYIGLERLSDLGELEGKEAQGIAGDIKASAKHRAGVFSEHLEFRTTLTAGVTPTLELSAVAGSFRLTNVSVSAVARRKDVHSLIIVLAIDPKYEDPIVRKAQAERSKMAGNSVRGSRTETALVQRNADARNRVLLELQRLRNLKDDEREGAKYLGERFLKFLRPPDDVGSED